MSAALPFAVVRAAYHGAGLRGPSGLIDRTERLALLRERLGPWRRSWADREAAAAALEAVGLKVVRMPLKSDLRLDTFRATLAEAVSITFASERAEVWGTHDYRAQGYSTGRSGWTAKVVARVRLLGGW